MSTLLNASVKSLLWLFLLSSFTVFSFNLNTLSSAHKLNFDEVVNQIKTHKHKTLTQVLTLSTSLEQQRDQFSLNQQIHITLLQADIFIDKYENTFAYQKAIEGLTLTKKLVRPDSLMTKLLLIKGRSKEDTEALTVVLQDYMAALEIARQLDDTELIIESLLHLGNVYRSNKIFDLALSHLYESLTLAQKLGDNKYEGLVNLHLGLLYQALILPEKEISFYNKAHRLLEKTNDTDAVFDVLFHKANFYVANNEPKKAMGLYQEVVLYAKKTHNPVRLAFTYAAIAKVHLGNNANNLVKAEQTNELARKLSQSFNHDVADIHIALNQFNLLTQLSRFDEAMKESVVIENTLNTQIKAVKSRFKPSLLRLQSALFYHQGLYKQALDLQQKYDLIYLQNSLKNSIQKIDDLRIQLELAQVSYKKSLIAKGFKSQSQRVYQNKADALDNTFYFSLSVITLIGIIWFYFSNVNNQKKILSRQETDYLTDLPNRKKILLMGATYYSANMLSVLVIKIDNFTKINQVKGYDIGNDILIEIASAVLNLLGNNGTCGRYSGSELLVLLPVCDLRKAKKIANEIHSYIYRNPWDEYRLKVVSVSIGVSHSDAIGINTYEELIQSAVAAKDRAVQAGGNAVCP